MVVYVSMGDEDAQGLIPEGIRLRIGYSRQCAQSGIDEDILLYFAIIDVCQQPANMPAFFLPNPPLFRPVRIVFIDLAVNDFRLHGASLINAISLGGVEEGLYVLGGGVSLDDVGRGDHVAATFA